MGEKVIKRITFAIKKREREREIEKENKLEALVSSRKGCVNNLKGSFTSSGKT